MSNKQVTHESENISPLELQLAVRQAALEMGLRIPSTPEEVATFIAGLDIKSVRKISTERALARLRGEPRDESIREIPIEAETCEDLAMAARNGAELSEEVKKLMKSDRDSAEKDSRSNG